MFPVKQLSLTLFAASLCAQTYGPDYVQQIRNKPQLDLRVYNFAPLTVNSSLTAATPATVTITAPLGVAGTDTRHYLWVNDGTSASEAVLITGGSCAVAGTTCTIQFTPANSHTSGWTLASATGGITEAANYSGGKGVMLLPPNTTMPLYVSPWIPSSMGLQGSGWSSVLQVAANRWAYGSFNALMGCADGNNESQCAISTAYPATGVTFRDFTLDMNGSAQSPQFTITGITNATPPVVTTSAANSFVTGQLVYQTGTSVAGYNGVFTVTALTATTYSLTGVSAAGAATGGTAQWSFTGSGIGVDGCFSCLVDHLQVINMGYGTETGQAIAVLTNLQSPTPYGNIVRASRVHGTGGVIGTCAGGIFFQSPGSTVDGNYVDNLCDEAIIASSPGMTSGTISNNETIANNASIASAAPPLIVVENASGVNIVGNRISGYPTAGISVGPISYPQGPGAIATSGVNVVGNVINLTSGIGMNCVGGGTYTISTISNATPPVVTTTTANNYVTGNQVVISENSVSAYNGTFTITVVDTTHFSLNGQSAAGAGSSGISTTYLVKNTTWTSNTVLGGTDGLWLSLSCSNAVVSGNLITNESQNGIILNNNNANILIKDNVLFKNNTSSTSGAGNIVMSGGQLNSLNNDVVSPNLTDDNTSGIDLNQMVTTIASATSVTLPSTIVAISGTTPIATILTGNPNILTGTSIKIIPTSALPFTTGGNIAGSGVTAHANVPCTATWAGSWYVSCPTS